MNDGVLYLTVGLDGIACLYMRSIISNRKRLRGKLQHAETKQMLKKGSKWKVENAWIEKRNKYRDKRIRSLRSCALGRIFGLKTPIIIFIILAVESYCSVIVLYCLVIITMWIKNLVLPLKRRGRTVYGFGG